VCSVTVVYTKYSSDAWSLSLVREGASAYCSYAAHGLGARELTVYLRGVYIIGEDDHDPRPAAGNDRPTGAGKRKTAGIVSTSSPGAGHPKCQSR
jgi:hypothetical protein